MIRSMCKALTAAAALTVVASVAMAGVPDPTQSTTDGDVDLGNARGGAIAALPNVRAAILDGYRVIVRDVGGTALGGVTVTMNFNGTGLEPHSTQTGGQTSNCATRVLSKVTDGGGQVIFFPATVGVDASAAPNVQVRANGVLLTTIRFKSVDLSCAGITGCVDGFDFNEFRKRFLNLAPETNLDPETDYATEGPSAGKTDGFDFNVFRTEFLCGAPSTCPVACKQTQCAVCP